MPFRKSNPIPKSLMVSVSGVRGIIGEGLHPEIISRFASAFGTYIGSGPVIIGKDTRPSGLILENSVIAGLAAVGTDICNIGVATTPTIQFAVKQHRMAGGVIISASHNPEHWNAIKFLGREGILLNQQQGLDVLEIAESQSLRYSDWQHLGKVKECGSAIKDHIDAVINLPLVSLSKIKRQKYKVVIDCINGAGSLILPHLLRKLGCEVIEINCALSGAFTHNPEPTGQSLRQLSQAVRRHKADIGFATDPDGDRLAVVDEHGKPWGEEYTLVAAVDYFLRKKKTPVVTNVSTTRAIDDIALRYQCEVFRAAVGEVNVIQKMIAVNSLIGGEGNGGVIVSDLHYGRDSVVGILLILQSLTEQQISAGKLRASFPDYHIIKEKIVADSQLFSKISRMLEKSIGDYLIDYTDGLKILGPDWWVHLRKSNTEPIVRLIVEAKTIKKAEALKNEYLQKIEESKSLRV